MRDISINTVDHTPRPVIAIERRYPASHVIAPHKHRRGQLISSAAGAIIVTTPLGRWVMPPGHGMWIPPGTLHDVRMIGAVRTQSLYLEADAMPDMPVGCQVVSISSFVRGLISEALDVPLEYKKGSRADALMTLLMHEIPELPALPLSLPYPSHTALAERCRRFVARPVVGETIDDWSSAMRMSRRAFTRLFRNETGLSFVEWRQRACLMAAMPKLFGGSSVTSVALDMGYENPAAFTTMFRRSFGVPPAAYVKARRDDPLAGSGDKPAR